MADLHVDTAPQPPAEQPGGPRVSRTLSPWSLLLAGAVAATLVLGQWMLLVGILGLALLITVHEFGHFIAAKSFGMRVEKFYIGFPPAALRRTWGETEYGVGIIPLGGFCKISGMTPEEEVPPGTGERVYYRKPIWQRNLAIFAGPLMNFVAAAVILVLFVGIQGVQTATLGIDEVVAGGPAAAAGLLAGDVIVGADGQEFATWGEASTYFRANPGKTIALTYRRGGEGAVRSTDVSLIENPDLPGSGYMGVRAALETRHPGPIEAAWLGLVGFKGVVTGTFTGFWWLFSGKISATGPDGAVGPVGIVTMSRQAVEQNWYPILLAYLSFNLGVINLLPILPFDGGHIAFNLLERVRGRRLDTRVFERVVAFGTVLLVALFIFLTFNDVKRLFGG
jgi:regulator of sigma E protease